MSPQPSLRRVRQSNVEWASCSLLPHPESPHEPNEESKNQKRRIRTEEARAEETRAEEPRAEWITIIESFHSFLKKSQHGIAETSKRWWVLHQIIARFSCYSSAKEDLQYNLYPILPKPQRHASLLRRGALKIKTRTENHSRCLKIFENILRTRGRTIDNFALFLQ